MSQKCKLSPGDLMKRHVHTAKTPLAQEIEKESDGQKSEWQYYETLNYMEEDVLRSLRAKEESGWTDNETDKEKL